MMPRQYAFPIHIQVLDHDESGVIVLVNNNEQVALHAPTQEHVTEFLKWLLASLIEAQQKIMTMRPGESVSAVAMDTYVREDDDMVIATWAEHPKVLTIALDGSSLDGWMLMMSQLAARVDQTARTNRLSLN